MGYRKKIWHGARWNAVSAFILIVGNIVQLAILTKWLTKSEFGQMAVVEAVCAIGLCFADLGLGNAIMHKKEVSRLQLTSLFWLNVSVGIVFTAIFWGISRPIAAFYGHPELLKILRLASVIFFTSSIGVQYKSILLKEMQFQPLAKADLLGFLVGFCTAVSLAVQHHGVEALVWGYLARQTTIAFSLVVFGWKTFAPALRFSWQEVKGYVSFGLYQIGDSLLFSLTNQADTLILGRTIGLEGIGVYSSFKTFILRPYLAINPILTKAYLPVVSAVKGEKGAVTKHYRELIFFLSAANAFIYLILFSTAQPLISILYRADWVPFSGIFQCFCVAGFFASLINPVGVLLISHGDMRRLFYWNTGVGLCFLALMLVFSALGLWTVAVVWMLFQITVGILHYFLLVKNFTQLKFSGYLNAVAKPFIIGIVMAFFLWPLQKFFYAQFQNPLTVFVLCASIAVMGYGLMFVRFFPQFLSKIRTIISNEAH